MKVARGNVRKLVIVLGKLQSMIGEARGLHENDVRLDSHEKAQDILREAFDLCVEARAEYRPVDD